MAESKQDAASSKTIAGVNEFLTFTLSHEEYGMEITKVQEIRGYDAVTKLANTPDFLKGITNLRGIIVPIIDMRIKFNMPHAEYNDLTVVIIINVAHRVVGMVVDGVSDVITLAPDQVKPAPEFGGAIDTKYVMGIGAVDERMLILVDIEKLMTGQDMDLVETAAAA